MMDIASLSTALSSVQASGSVQNDVGVLMLSKQLDLTETMGAEMVKAMEQSVNPNLGVNFDVSV